MVSITHKDDQIVESKEITPISSPKNRYNSNNDELNDADEEEVNVCDTCGVQGLIYKLAICDNCGIGAKHTYCMAEQLEDVPERWFCDDCVEDSGSIKENSKASIDLLEMGKSGFQKQNDSSIQKSSGTGGLGLNIEPNLNLSPNIDLNPSKNLNVNPNIDLNVDMNLDPNLDLRADNNLDLSLDCGSNYRSSSTSNCQAHKRRRASQNPLPGQGSLEEEEEEEAEDQQSAKRPRVDTRLSL